MPDQHAAIAVGRRHTNRLLDHRAVVKPPVAADHQRELAPVAGVRQSRHRLDEPASGGGLRRFQLEILGLGFEEPYDDAVPDQRTSAVTGHRAGVFSSGVGQQQHPPLVLGRQLAHGSTLSPAAPHEALRSTSARAR